jgi:hypothetical protein
MSEWSLACWLVVGIAASVSAQAQTGSGQQSTQQGEQTSAPAVISTDRPAITDASTVVPKSEMMFENGLTETGYQGQQSVDLPETLVRFGITSKTEFRFTAPDYFANYNAGRGVASGFGDLALGFKQQLVARSNGFDVALIGSLSFPVGADRLSSHGYDPGVLLPWSHPISKNWTAAGMFSVAWPTQGGRRNATGQASFLIDRQLTSRWDAFLEYGGYYPERGGAQQILHTGTSFKVTNNQQLDFHAGFGLSSAAVDHFVGFGYSFQFRAIPGERN